MPTNVRYIGAPRPEAAAPESKFARFRNLLYAPELSFIMEAHNGLSAKIVEEAGFPGIWASGLSISAAMGVRDSNEASWTQVLEVLEFMADATSIPILVDGDTGYGNFNNMRRLVSMTANIEGEDLGRVAERISRAVKETGKPPAGVQVDVRGQVTPMREMFRGLAFGLAIAVVVIFLLLTAYFESHRAR